MSENQHGKNNLKAEIRKQVLGSLKIFSIFTVIAGAIALVFEVRHFSDYALDIYIARLGAALVAFIVLLLAQTKIGKKYSIFLIHILLLAIIASFGYVIFTIPQAIVLNSQIISLILFTAALFLSWEVSNQITVAIYYNIVFALSIMVNDQSIYILPNMFESVLFVLLISLMSIAASSYNYKIRKESILKSLAIEESEKKFKDIFENSVEGIFTSDLEGNFAIGNPAFVSMLGYKSIDEIKSLDLSIQLYRNSKDLELFLKLLERHGKVKNYRLFLKKNDGKEIIVRCSARICLDDQNNPVAIEGAMQDITRQVKAEKEKDKLMEELKKAKSIADDSSLQAKTESSVKTKFLSKLAHEIKTPLNSIMAFLTMIHDDLFENYKELKNFALEIQTSADMLLEIINKNLDLSQIESGKIELSENKFSLKNEIEKTINIVNSTIKSGSVKIFKEIDERIPAQLIGDEKRLRQVLINILTNAVKFTGEGEVHLTASFEGKSDTHAQVFFSIKDNGPGISEEDIPGLFNPYTTTSDKSSSGGLSLAISKELLNLMGGQIEVESSLGEGSNFMFTTRFKLIDAVEKPKEKIVEEEAPEEMMKDTSSIERDMEIMKAAESTTGRKKRILLVEDNPISQNVEMKILREVGYSVEAVGSGIEAIKSIEEKQYDLVLMDVEMEGMDGIQATQKIREMEGDVSKIPVIAVTAHSSMKDRERCLSAGMDDYIAKPINIQFLKMTIDQWLNDNRIV